jgi:hypothetical protein
MGERVATEDKGGKVDQPVPGRDERRHVVQPVDVDAEPAREDVLHRRGVDHDDGNLDPGGPALAAQGCEQQQPGAGPEEPLLEERRARVEPEHDHHPHGHHRRDPEVVAVQHHLRIPWR